MWVKKIYQIVIGERLRGIAILAILSVAMDVRYVQAVEYNFDYIDDFKKEAQELVGETSKGGLSEEVKGIEGYTDKPKETEYSEYELRSKGDARVKGQEKDENEGVREAIGAAKSSYAENPHRSNYTVGKLQHKEFIKKSDAVTSNPISGLNAEGKAECKIADKDLGGENVEFEEYYVDVEDTRLIRGDKKCEEDEDRLFYCTRKIKDVKCASKSDCGYNESGIRIESIAVETASARMRGIWSDNKRTGPLDVSWEYNYPILRLGPPYKAWERFLYLINCSNECCEMTMKSSIDIKNAEKIKSFILKKVPSGVFIDIRVNGHHIYNSSGGYKLEVKLQDGLHRISGVPIGGRYKVDSGNGKIESCLLYYNDRTLPQINENIEMKKYLVEGKNSIEIKIVWTNWGTQDPFVSIEASQYCCNDWSDEWEGDCPL